MREGGPIVLDGFFTPESIVVVGVAREPGKVGHFVFRNLLDGGFAGTVWPVNPKADEILGHRCYANVSSLPGVPDLAVIAVPAVAVAAVVAECGIAGIRSVVVLSAGFKETGPAGARLERELIAAATAGGVRVLGPNSLGLVATPSALNAAFAGSLPRTGGVAFLSQSGALGTGILDESAGAGPGIAYFVSLGNRADVAEHDLLIAWNGDPRVRVAAGYLESVKDGPAFIAAAKAFVKHAPLVLLKAGTSDAGARAVSSHTGSLAGSDVAYDAALKDGGILRVRTTEQLMDAALAFDLLPIPPGPGLALLTNAGGLGVLATDEAERRGIALASLEADTVAALRACLPDAAAFYNPVDVLGDAPPERYAQGLAALAADPGVHTLVVMLTPQAMSRPSDTAREIVSAAEGSAIPVIACFVGGEAVAEGRTILRDGGVPCYPSPERAVFAASLLESYRRSLATTPEEQVAPQADIAAATAELVAARDEGATFVIDEGAARIAAAFGISVPCGSVAHDQAEALRIAEECGYPVALKISSPDILHKSDVGGVVIGIEDAKALSTAYDALLDRVRRRSPGAAIRGVYVQSMVPGGRELIVGIDRDATFGPLLMVGLGGVYVEVLKDVTFRLCPVSPKEAKAMLASLGGYALLRGVRGEQAADLDAAADIISRVSWMAASLPQIVELDINPVIVRDRGLGATAADVRIGIGG